jgi:hypothetical protein
MGCSGLKAEFIPMRIKLNQMNQQAPWLVQELTIYVPVSKKELDEKGKVDVGIGVL